MKRYIISILCMVMTAIGAYSQGADTEMPLTVIADIDAGNDATITGSWASSDAAYHNAFDYKQTPEWKRYKVLRAVGWSALGVGLPTAFVGLVGVGLSTIEGGDPYGGFIAILAAGGVLTLSSIPILISAYHYRGKAKRMALDMTLSRIHTPDIACSLPKSTPALTLTLKF